MNNQPNLGEIMKSVSAINFAVILLASATMGVATGCAKKDTAAKSGDTTSAISAPNATVRSADTTPAAAAATPAHADWVRAEPINVKAIDANKDGKVYQCPMDPDFNVISDTAGTCPKCEMKIEEVTVAKAEENLKGAGKKVEG
jgi:hypothetical protein